MESVERGRAQRRSKVETVFRALLCSGEKSFPILGFHKVDINKIFVTVVPI